VKFGTIILSFSPIFTYHVWLPWALPCSSADARSALRSMYRKVSASAGVARRWGGGQRAKTRMSHISTYIHVSYKRQAYTISDSRKCIGAEVVYSPRAEQEHGHPTSNTPRTTIRPPERRDRNNENMVIRYWVTLCFTVVYVWKHW
jgi:hypothetical protein